MSMSLHMLAEAVVIWRHTVVNQKIYVFVKVPIIFQLSEDTYM